MGCTASQSSSSTIDVQSPTDFGEAKFKCENPLSNSNSGVLKGTHKTNKLSIESSHTVDRPSFRSTLDLTIANDSIHALSIENEPVDNNRVSGGSIAFSPPNMMNEAMSTEKRNSATSSSSLNPSERFSIQSNPTVDVVDPMDANSSNCYHHHKKEGQQLISGSNPLFQAKKSPGRNSGSDASLVVIDVSKQLDSPSSTRDSDHDKMRNSHHLRLGSNFISIKGDGNPLARSSGSVLKVRQHDTHRMGSPAITTVQGQAKRPVSTQF